MTETTATQITEMWPLPQGWEGTTLGEVSLVNPRSFIQPPEENQPVSFVPMAAVEAASGQMHAKEVKLYHAVRKGYTPFSEGDVLFAKITPCMENGKIAVAEGLEDGRGCGSTEFHVLRNVLDGMALQLVDAGKREHEPLLQWCCSQSSGNCRSPSAGE